MTATLEQLERVPVGATVRVQDVPWERVDGGLSRSGTVLSLDHFVGYLSANLVSMPVAWRPSTFYTIGGGRQTRYVTHVLDGVAHFLVFSNGTGEVEKDSAPEGEVGAWVELRTGSERIWHRRVRGVENLLSGRVHVSKVRITGTTYWTPTIAEASAFVGAGVRVDDVDDSVTIRWVREVTVANTGEGCLCDQVDNAALEQYLPTEFEDWDYTTECG